MPLRLLAAALVVSGVYGSDADRLADPKDAVVEQFRIWQSTQARIYETLKTQRDPCNSKLIVSLIEPLKREAKSYFDKRTALLKTYAEDRARTATALAAFSEGADLLLDPHASGRAAQEKLLAAERERLGLLPPDAEQARQALDRTIHMREEHLANISADAGDRDRADREAALRDGDQIQTQAFKSEMQLVSQDAELVENNYDAQVSRYDQACVAMPIARPTRPKKKKP